VLSTYPQVVNNVDNSWVMFGVDITTTGVYNERIFEKEVRR